MYLGRVKTPWEAWAKSLLEWCCLAAVAAAVVGGFLGHLRVAVWPGIVLIVVVVVCSKTLTRRAAFKGLRGLRDIGFRVCPWCGYDLRSLDEEGACPECGEPFDPETLGREWRGRLEPAARG